MLQVKRHPVLFREIYSARRVRNVYLDTPSLDCFKDNVQGRSNRFKTRIRWYGDPIGRAIRPVLEVKIKEGFLGRKESVALLDFDTAGDVRTYIENALRPVLRDRPDMMPYVAGLRPVVANAYMRRYFKSADARFRLTIDWDVEYAAVTARAPLFAKAIQDPNIILELKYAAVDDDRADVVTGRLPYRLVRNSKYMNAIDLVYA